MSDLFYLFPSFSLISFQSLNLDQDVCRSNLIYCSFSVIFLANHLYFTFPYLFVHCFSYIFL